MCSDTAISNEEWAQLDPGGRHPRERRRIDLVAVRFLRSGRPFTLERTRDVYVFAASGRATLHSYVINHRAMPGSGFEAPYAIAVAELEEGPRMMTNIVDCPQTPEALALDMPLEVVFESVSDEISLPLFRPATGS